MQDQLIYRDPDSCLSDEAWRRAVLVFVLSEHPRQVPLGEMRQELLPAEAEFGERDACQRAVRDLLSTGLLVVNAELVGASRAALEFERLETA